jgi:hypothetical protein
MRIILPFGALLALSLTSCASSENLFTGPPNDTKPTMEPGRKQPSQPCAPSGDSHGRTGRSSAVRGSISACTVISPSP